jgi:hypothetical protein
LTDGSSTLPAVFFLSHSSTGLFKTAQGLGVSVQGTATLDIRNNALISNVDVLEPFNVLYHGMDNTGQTNCSTIMNALVTASASTGRAVYFPRGTYLFTSSITFINSTKGFRIYGDGKETIIMGEMTSNASLRWFQDATGISVDNMYFGGDRRNGSLLARALSFSNPPDCQTNKFWFYDMQSPCFMYVDNSNLPDTNQVYRNNHIKDCFTTATVMMETDT